MEARNRADELGSSRVRAVARVSVLAQQRREFARRVMEFGRLYKRINCRFSVNCNIHKICKK